MYVCRAYVWGSGFGGVHLCRYVREECNHLSLTHPSVLQQTWNLTVRCKQVYIDHHINILAHDLGSVSMCWCVCVCVCVRVYRVAWHSCVSVYIWFPFHGFRGREGMDTVVSSVRLSELREFPAANTEVCESCDSLQWVLKGF